MSVYSEISSGFITSEAVRVLQPFNYEDLVGGVVGQ